MTKQFEKALSLGSDILRGLDSTSQPYIRVLLVDDSDDDAALLRRALPDNQYRLDVVQNAEDALPAILTHAHDLYLIDYTLPGMSGDDLVNKCRASGISGPFILWTGHSHVRSESTQIISKDILLEQRESLPAIVRVAISLFRKTHSMALDQASAAMSTVNACMAAFILFFLVGCTHNAANLKRVDTKQDERTREVIQAAKVANDIGHQRLASHETNSVVEAMIAYDLSATYLRRGQGIMGLPIVDQTAVVADLLSSNAKLKAAAEAVEKERVTQEQEWAQERAELNRKLLEMGAKYEEEHNKSIVRRVWGWLFSTLGIGGIIALCFLCPAVIPIFARMLAWVVGKFPKLAGAMGVVSTQAFDAVMRGIHRAKKEWGTDDADPKETLEVNLSREMDLAHKSLVEARLPLAEKQIALRGAVA